MAKKPSKKPDPDLKYIERLDAGETEQLRGFYTEYGAMCIDGAGSPQWARATCKLVVELLDRLEKLESAPVRALDQTSELKAGDTVFSLVNYMGVTPGTLGKVVDIVEGSAYPIAVRFDEIDSTYLKDSTARFKREELGKVGNE